uniref:Myosin-J heavy chain n=1 Tax=Tanacetum cinerariifolium TaxID=118510 RepID=A0A699I9C6_TANCI|nr:myosin-J heavy chain [Tanacetum cinerariifolium]
MFGNHNCLSKAVSFRKARSSDYVNTSFLDEEIVEAKRPALQFKQKLTKYVEKLYGMIHDNFKKDIQKLLELCIQAPRISSQSLFGRTVVAFASAASQDSLMYAHSAWDELLHIRQAVGFLAMHQKPKTLDEITHYMCPALSLQQLYKIISMYTDDTYRTFGLAPDVISELKLRATEDSFEAIESSFLLDDDTSIPFSVDDLSKSMDQINVEDIEPPPLMRDNSGFSFLLPHDES